MVVLHYAVRLFYSLGEQICMVIGLDCIILYKPSVVANEYYKVTEGHFWKRPEGFFVCFLEEGGCYFYFWNLPLLGT